MSDSADYSQYQAALKSSEHGGLASLMRGGSMLRFENAVESEFFTYRRESTLPVTRVGIMLASFLYIAFFGIDALTYQRYQVWWTVIPILLTCCTANTLLFAASFSVRLRAYFGWACAVVVFINAFAFAFSSAQGYLYGINFPPEAPAIQQMYILLLLSLPFRLCAPMSFVVFSTFMVLHLLVGVHGEELFMRGFMMAAAGLLGTFACFLTEREQRLAWLRARLLQELSEHDSLTGLYNHRIFYLRGEQLLKQARRDRCGVAVLVGDVDHFKKFNDTHGHLAGDEALRHVAKSLGKGARRPLHIAARLGGEEFGLLLYNVSAETAHQRADELRNSVRGLMLSEGRRVTISIGIVMMAPETVTTIEALIGAADSALYRAKEAGRDRVAS